MTHINGTDIDDYFVISSCVESVSGRKGDDFFVLDSRRDVRVDGGFGFDSFDFQALIGQTVTFNEIDDKTVIKIFDDATNDQIQKIVLLDVENITWSMIG